MNRKEAEDAREDKLVELRKKYLDSKGIISKAKPSAKVKLTGLDKVEAEREAKLVELRKKYLAKKRAVAKKKSNTVVTAGKQRTVKTREGGNSTDTGKQRTVKTRAGNSVVTAGKQRTVKTRAGKGSVKSPASSSQRTVKTRAGKKKPLAPTTSVRPIARTTATDPKTKKGYFVDKKKGNAMVRVFPNDVVGGWDNMTNAERKAKGYPTSDSKKYSIDYNQRNALTFIIKK